MNHKRLYRLYNEEGWPSRMGASPIHASVFNHFNHERHLCFRANFKMTRAAALAEWRDLFAA